MSSPDLIRWRLNESQGAEILFLGVSAVAIGGEQQPIVSAGPYQNRSEQRAQLMSNITDSHQTQLKAKFLDHFAELLAREKDPRFISADALVERSSSISVYAARNDGLFEDTDYTFFTQLSVCLPDIHQQHSKRKSRQLLSLMLGYYVERIAFHAGDLAGYYRTLPKITRLSTIDERETLAQLDSLIKSCERFHRKMPRDILLAGNISAQAKKLKVASSLKRLAPMFYGDTILQQLKIRLRGVSRIRTIHRTTIDCATSLPSFAHFHVETLALTQSQRRTHRSVDMAKQSVLETLAGLRLTLPSAMDKPGVVRALLSGYQKKLIIHAEMQVLFFFLSAINAGLRPFEYIGISKRPCYNCAGVLKEMDLFETRPSHGHICPQWTLPRSLDVPREHAWRLHGAINAVKEKLAEAVCRRIGRKLTFQRQSTPAATSTIAESSIEVASVSNALHPLQIARS